MRKLGIYVHIPFCVRRCRYCAFYSNEVGDRSTPDVAKFEREYILSQVEKIRKYAAIYGREREVDSIFIGGGTPSILPPEMIGYLLARVRENFRVTEDAEISLESNPGTLSQEKLDAYLEMGVNRLSIGIQSLDPAVLDMLGRIHSPEDGIRSFQMARSAGFQNVNIDLMFGIPGQRYGSWLDTLTGILDLNPEHISFYSLQLEEGTPFFDNYRNGKVPKIDTDLDRVMYHEAIREMREAGYEHYEISNAARPGFRCRHNQKYWRFQEYLGIGANASSFIAGARFTEEPDSEYHLNSFMDDASEYVFTGLRMMEGISRKAFAETFGRGFWDVFGDRRDSLREYFDQGLLIEDGDILRLSEEGIDCSNEVMAVFV